MSSSKPRNSGSGTWEVLGTLGSTTANRQRQFQRDDDRCPDRRELGNSLPDHGDGNNWDNGDNFYVDNLTITIARPASTAASTPSTAVSGTTPTRSALGDGNELINEAVNADQRRLRRSHLDRLRTPSTRR